MKFELIILKQNIKSNTYTIIAQNYTEAERIAQELILNKIDYNILEKEG
jgi:poly(A) polymerase Pap1